MHKATRAHNREPTEQARGRLHGPPPAPRNLLPDFARVMHTLSQANNVLAQVTNDLHNSTEGEFY